MCERVDHAFHRTRPIKQYLLTSVYASFSRSLSLSFFLYASLNRIFRTSAKYRLGFAVSVGRNANKNGYLSQVILAQRCTIEAYQDFRLLWEINSLALVYSPPLFSPLSLFQKSPILKYIPSFLCHSFCLIFLPVSCGPKRLPGPNNDARANLS